MTLTQLEYVLAIHDTGSFNKAAEKCFVTQPTLSQQVKKLEDLLGVMIFDRSAHPVAPTPMGLRILEHARTVVREAEHIKGLVGEESKTLHGDLRLGVIPTLAPFLLPPLAAHLRKEYPLLKIHVEEMQTSRIMEALAADTLDVGLLVTPLENDKLIERPVFYEPFYLYFSEGHPIGKVKRVSERDLNAREMHLLSEGHCFRSQMLQLCRAVPPGIRRVGGRAGGGRGAAIGAGSGPGAGGRGEGSRRNSGGHDSATDRGEGPRHSSATGAGSVLPANDASGFTFESGSLQTLKRMVDQVGGYTLLPDLACREMLTRSEETRIRHFVDPVPVREVSLVSHRHFLKQRMLDVLHESILKLIPKDLRDPSGGRGSSGKNSREVVPIS